MPPARRASPARLGRSWPHGASFDVGSFRQFVVRPRRGQAVRTRARRSPAPPPRIRRVIGYLAQLLLVGPANLDSFPFVLS
jgi:hypothetical protein